VDEVERRLGEDKRCRHGFTPSEETAVPGTTLSVCHGGEGSAWK
jgi:hypothetical protein